jgi:hypothetical protein
MPTETTKKQTEHQDSNTGSKPHGTQGNEDTRTAEQHYGGHRDSLVQGGSAGTGTQQNPQGKQEPPAQPGQTRERGGAADHSGQHNGGSSSQQVPPPAQQGQHGQAGGPSDRSKASPSNQGGQKKEHQDNQTKDQRR